jgi:predicted transposase/invertase (TIGR01784 family)
MKTDKLFYRIFLNQPDLIAELIPGIPSDCEFEYSAPVLKEKETRLDGLLTPTSNNSDVPLIFLEAQMQRDPKFYSRYFQGIFSYIDQYEISRNWRGLLILLNKRLELGSELPHRNLLNSQVERLYLEDLLYQDDLSPNLALLRLIVTPKDQAGLAARKILNSVSTEAEFQLKLDLVESILVNKFTQLTLEEIQKMLNLKETDITQTRFYQEVLEIGEKKGIQQGMQQGVQQGEANLTIRLLKRRCGNLTAIQEQKVRSLSISQLESLGEALLDFPNMSDWENWLQDNRR